MANELKITTDKSSIERQLSKNIKNIYKQLLKNNIIPDFAKEINKMAALSNWKNIFKELKDILNKTENLIDYLEAYEKILEFREYLLGSLGKIYYQFLIQNSDQKNNRYIQTAYMDGETFKDLILNKDQSILEVFKGNIRFTEDFRQQLSNLQNNNINISISQSASFFSIENELIGTKVDFNSGPLFISHIQKLQEASNHRQKYYQFKMLTALEKDHSQKAFVFKFQINHVNGNARSSSVFSAIGKYIADELSAKQQRVSYYSGKRRGVLKGYDQKLSDYSLKVNLNPPNIGQLSEFYELAKIRLNNGRNVFEKEQNISGQTLLQIWREAKNSDPFYSGGDVLMNQVKSFIGKNPSLTSYSVIKNAIIKFYNALNQDKIQNIQKELAKLLLQKNNVNFSDIEQSLAEKMIKVFNDSFKN